MLEINQLTNKLEKFSKKEVANFRNLTETSPIN